MATLKEIRSKLESKTHQDLIKQQIDQEAKRIQDLTTQYGFKKSHRYIWIDQNELENMDYDWEFDVDPLYIALLCEIVFQKTPKKKLTSQITMDLIKYQEEMEVLNEVIEGFYEDQEFFNSEEFGQIMQRELEKD
jgi:hypothetical protein